MRCVDCRPEKVEAKVEVSTRAGWRPVCTEHHRRRQALANCSGAGLLEVRLSDGSLDEEDELEASTAELDVPPVEQPSSTTGTAPDSASCENEKAEREPPRYATKAETGLGLRELAALLEASARELERAGTLIETAARNAREVHGLTAVALRAVARRLAERSDSA